MIPEIATTVRKGDALKAMKEPDVSVVVPCFNGSSFLRQCIESVFRQGCDAEVIVVDDGSEDDSGRVARELAISYPDRVLAVSKSNGGPASARNAGIRLARGKFICFLDVDDEYVDGSLSAGIRALEG